MANFPDPEGSKYGPKGAKKQGPILAWKGWNKGGTRVNHNEGHLYKPVMAFFSGTFLKKIGPGAPEVAKRGKNRSKYYKLG